MDIVNWDAIKKDLLIRNTLESPDDLVLVAANTTYKKRGDLFQTYAIPASALAGGGTTITLQTNGSDNGDQTLLNLRANGGSGIILEDTGTGTVLISTDQSKVKTALITSVNQVYPTSPVGGAWRDITGLSFSVISGKTYAFTFEIFFRVTNAAPQNYGISWSVSGSNTFSALNVVSEFPGTATPVAAANWNSVSYHQAYDDAVIFGQTTALATIPVVKATVSGIMTATSNGVFSARSFAEASANLVILAGSSGEYLVTA